MTPRAVLFDNDGVLVETEQLYYQATRDVMADVGPGAWHLFFRSIVGPGGPFGPDGPLGSS